ncbi:MAG: bifunctional folylpolyglutamate synthase/dihydrofolate synthase [Verrucomicrobiales bacterium]|nr:bifunctional folylpolyglutamate synthase/dihydrofolate synthase [Verrucomicrobiales bacterium]
MDYEEAIEWLYGTQLMGIKLGLQGTRRLFEALHLFEQLEGREIFHVAGTNGKGSVCAMIDSIACVEGKRSGLFTSPHLICFRERIRIDGEMISEESVAEILSELRAEVDGWQTHPTFFELTLALAVKYFCQNGVEVLVMETGMGGRLDATNVLPATVSVITSVGLDHQQWLGEDLASIAKEKAGIIKPGAPVITAANQEGEVLEVLRRAAEEAEVDLFELVPLDEGGLDESFALRGPHQRLNAALAKKAVQCVWPSLSDEVVTEGLREVSWAGRFEVRADGMVLDGAHNPAAMSALVATWREQFGDRRATVLFSAADSKEVATMLGELAQIAASFVFVPLRAKRGLQVDALIAALQQSAARELAYSQADQLQDALEQARARGGRVLVTGSLFLVGEVLAFCEQQQTSFEPSEQ